MAALRRLHYVERLIALEGRFLNDAMSGNPCRSGIEIGCTRNWIDR